MKHLIIFTVLINIKILTAQANPSEYIHHDFYEYRSSTKIVCSNGCFKWHWLKKEDNTDYKTTGRWAQYKQIYHTNSGYKTFIIMYFMPSNENVLNEMTSKCVEQFGSDYIYIHPANSILDNWHLFRSQDGYFLEGKTNFKEEVCDFNHKFCQNKTGLFLYKKYLTLEQYIRKYY